jgi:AraC-like DNA-binding protein
MTPGLLDLMVAHGYRDRDPMWDSNKLFDLLMTVYPGLTDIDNRRPGQVLHQMHSFFLGSIGLMAGRHSALYGCAEQTGGMTFTIYYAGSSTYEQDGKQFLVDSPECGLLIADADGAALTTDVSTLVIRFQPERVIETAQVMLADTPFHIDLSPQLIDLKARNLCAYVRSLPHILTALSSAKHDAEDTLYRFLARATTVPTIPGKRQLRACRKREGLDLACAFMMDHLAQEITLTDIERAANLSARTLQVAFLERFGMSPRGWLTEQRLLRVFSDIERAGPEVSMAEIATRCGFSHHGRFAGLFKSRFGLLPSQLRERRLH